MLLKVHLSQNSIVLKALDHYKPVTQQPDIADIFINCGSLSEADQDNIASYLEIFLKEAFHELCIEQIFED